MKKILLIFLILLILFSGNHINGQTSNQVGDVKLVIHGGAGTITKDMMTPQQEKTYRSIMSGALDHGYNMLKQGKSSIEVVMGVIRILENSPLFNAGKGSVYTSEAKIEMDASIMDGATLNAGAVASVTTIKNPILAAYEVLESSPHVLLTGDGAEKFSQAQGLEIVDPSYFHTERRMNDLKKDQEREQKGKGSGPRVQPDKWGTVGAVALDKNGNIAAGTSTGGITNKRHGRIGDTPIIGAGVYADNRFGGISSTGQGEYFIRTVAAYEIIALMKYQDLKIQDAADKVIHQTLKELGGYGGVIGLDSEGNIMISFNTPGMYRGYIEKANRPVVLIYD